MNESKINSHILLEAILSINSIKTETGTTMNAYHFDDDSIEKEESYLHVVPVRYIAKKKDAKRKARRNTR